MQIVDSSYFSNVNFIHIPQAVPDPSTTQGLSQLDFLCVKLERELLLNAFGLSIANEIKAITDIDNASDRLKKLIQGEEYNGKIWIGLDNDDSLIANYIYQEFVTKTNTVLSSTGAKKVNPENATNQTPAYLIAGAHQNFIKQYQNEYLTEPIVTQNLIDWYALDNTEKSLYGYLMDKREIFTEWKPEFFKVYETKNSFGL